MSDNRSDSSSPLWTAAGVGLVGVGLSHFVRPQLYDGVTAVAFPQDTRRYVHIHGGVETALGAALAVPATRKVAVAGLVGYLGWLAGNALRHR